MINCTTNKLMHKNFGSLFVNHKSKQEHLTSFTKTLSIKSLINKTLVLLNQAIFVFLEYTSLQTRETFLFLHVLTTMYVWNGHEFSSVTVRKTGEDQDMITVYTSNGRKLNCTLYHKFHLAMMVRSKKLNS